AGAAREDANRVPGADVVRAGHTPARLARRTCRPRASARPPAVQAGADVFAPQSPAHVPSDVAGRRGRRAARVARRGVSRRQPGTPARRARRAMMPRVFSGRVLLRVVLVVSVVATIGCDRLTKRIATERLAGVPGRSFFADTVRFEYAENAGGFLSLGEDLPPMVRRVVFVGGTGLLML